MNIGILGTGSIARTMAAEFAKVPAFRCEAVCSRQQATGEALAQQFGIPKVYTDYDAMLADPDIELVYIATPNSLHYAQTKAALLAGKNVLCEKPFVPTVAEADELIALAKEKHLFLFEAITTAHHPNYALAKQYLDDIGSLRIVSASSSGSGAGGVQGSQSIMSGQFFQRSGSALKASSRQLAAAARPSSVSGKISCRRRAGSVISSVQGSGQ